MDQDKQRNGLKNLADYLVENPDLPVPTTIYLYDSGVVAYFNRYIRI